jgi:ABC-type uncharacterized transport system permease subunit
LEIKEGRMAFWCRPVIDVTTGNFWFGFVVGVTVTLLVGKYFGWVTF